jgi:TRAP-type transport system periplasmic protein
MSNTCQVLASALIAAALGFAGTANSQEVVLRAASMFDAGTSPSKPFERFIDFVNAEGKGVIRIQYVGGGGKIMSPFEMGSALKTGVFDVLNGNSGFYSNLLPEAAAIKLIRKPLPELRESGAWEYLQKLENQKMNAHLLTFSMGYMPFHIYLRKGVTPPSGPDFKGIKLRSTPNHQAVFTALKAIGIRMDPHEIYSGMERGVVDGFGWPIYGMDEIGLLPTTGFRIDPGYFVAVQELLINLNTWNKLNARQKAVLQFGATWLEAWLPAYTAQLIEINKKLQADAGVRVVQYKGADAERMLEMAYKAAWEEVIRNNPEQGPKLRQLLDR